MELLAVKREVKDGMYRSYLYALSNLVVQFPLMAILSLACLFPGPYPMMDFPLQGFGVGVLHSPQPSSFRYPSVAIHYPSVTHRHSLAIPA